MNGNARVLRRLVEAIDRFAAGSAPLEDLQAAILAHGGAVEGLGNRWLDLIDEVEGAIDSVRFTVAASDQAAAARPLLERLRRAAVDALEREPA